MPSDDGRSEDAAYQGRLAALPPHRGLPREAVRGGLRIEATGLSRRAGDRWILRDVSVSVEPGRLVAVAGASGAGKTTLLNTLAGLRAPDTGDVRYDGVDRYSHPREFRSRIGYVPQDDIIHRGLTLRRTLAHAARLRLPARTPAAARAAETERVLAEIGLADRMDTPVGSLSGGQRKRACLAVELLTRPRAVFLDEPTSGLDPATAAGVMRLLRRLAEGGMTVVLTTHNPADLRECHTLALLAPGGHLVFEGPPARVCAYFGVAAIEDVYTRLAEAEEGAPQAWAREFAAVRARMADLARTVPSLPTPLPPGATPPVPPMLEPGPTRALRALPPSGRAVSRPDGTTPRDVRLPTTGAPPAVGPGAPPETGSATSVPADAAPAAPQQAVRLPGPLRQWVSLTGRSLDLLVRNRLTLAILLGSPVMILMMFVVLFRPGAFSPAAPDPNTTMMTVFWIAFGGFFFGLTYGLPQICGEAAIVRRERLVGVRLGAYVAAKLTVLLPLLTIVDAAFLVVLQAMDRLPPLGWHDDGMLLGTLVLSSASALGLGLLASAVVSDPAQAVVALPLLCFPQVLFSGAILPVPTMAGVGRAITYAMSNRWTFEALGHGVGLPRLWAHGASPLGQPMLASFGDTFSRSARADWCVLAGFAVLLLTATGLVMHVRFGGTLRRAPARARDARPAPRPGSPFTRRPGSASAAAPAAAPQAAHPASTWPASTRPVGAPPAASTSTQPTTAASV